MNQGWGTGQQNFRNNQGGGGRGRFHGGKGRIQGRVLSIQGEEFKDPNVEVEEGKR